ncbi:MAG: TRAP-type mannitol/chloroaromatic compound transport system permease small subunit, partial [Halieaceae bacterium]
MSWITELVSLIDRITVYTGKALAWLGLAMALLTASIVLLRYGFGLGSIAMQEATIYMHACLFMLGAAYTLKTNSHVRVDIFYRKFSPRTRSWVNCLGTIVFLMPLCAFLVGVSWDYVTNSWAIREVSAEPGGLPAVFLLKSLIFLMAANLGAQALAELLRNATAL